MVILPRAKAETRGGNRNTIRRGTPPRAIWEMYDEEKKKKKRKNKKRKKFILCESEDKNGENKESRGIWEVRMHDKWKMKLATYSEGVS